MVHVLKKIRKNKKFAKVFHLLREGHVVPEGLTKKKKESGYASAYFSSFFFTWQLNFLLLLNRNVEFQAEHGKLGSWAGAGAD